MNEIRTASVSEKHHEITKNLLEIKNLFDLGTFSSEPKQLIARVKADFVFFERAPKLLDSALSDHVSAIASVYFIAKKQRDNAADSKDIPVTLELIANLIYVLSKIRGQQHVANKLSSDVYLFPQLVATLSVKKEICGPSETYFLLLWLTRLVLVPFPLESVENGLASKLYTIAQYNLGLHSTASKTQVVASAMLASLITRADCSDVFVRYTESVVVDWPVLPRTNAQLGYLMALNQILKKRPSAQILALVPEVHANVVNHEISQLELDKPDVMGTYSRSSSINTMNALYLIKISAKLAKFAVGQRDFGRVASLIESPLDLMHLMGDQFDTSLRECMAKNMARTVAYLATKATNYADQVITYFVKELGIVSLQESAVFSRDLQIEQNNLSVPRYHSILLFLGFLALTKSLPQKFVPLLFSITHKTVFVSQREFSWVQTSQIRDASCFCLWATFRMLSKTEFCELSEKFSDLVPSIFVDLIKVSLFDEDFTMRRCGIAVLQEFLGRFGSEFLPTILQTSDQNRIGEFTVQFIEQFSASAVGNLSDSHDVIHILISMGFPVQVFYRPLLEEVLAETSSFELQKLGSRHLAKVLTVSAVYAPSINVLVGNFPPADEVVGSLMANIKTGTFGSLFALAELHNSGILPSSTAQEISSIVKSMPLKRDASVAFLGESIMRWINANSGVTAIAENDDFSSVVAKLQRIDATKGLVNEFQIHFRQIPVIDPQTFRDIFHQVRLGSKVLASSVMSLPLDFHALGELCIILRDGSVDAEIRSTLVSTITARILDQDTSLILKSTMVDLLDDYTISDQGDVGSRVRGVCISLIAAHLHLFSSMRKDVILKLVRIAGETIDRLRIGSFEVLCDMHGLTKYARNRDKYNANYDVYFADLFDVYENICFQIGDDNAVEFKEAFWKGLVHSAAASTGANTMINSSFRHVLEHVTESGKLESTFKTLVSLLRIPPGIQVSALDKRVQKMLVAMMNLLVKVFDSGIIIPPTIDLNVLYVRAYNLHLNTKVIARIAPAIRLFEQISTNPNVSTDLGMKCRKRLCWLSCNHANAQVRALAADSVFEVANEFDTGDIISKIFDQFLWGLKKPKATVLSELEHTFLTI